MDAVTLSENKGEETSVSTNSAQTASQSLFNQASLTQGTEHGQYVQSAPLVPVVQDTSQSQGTRFGVTVLDLMMGGGWGSV